MSEDLNEELEAQPNGMEFQKTLHVVNEILTNPEFCEQVREHHGWPKDMSSDRVALVFLTARFQWAIELLSLQTKTLKRQVDGCETRVVALEDADAVRKYDSYPLAD